MEFAENIRNLKNFFVDYSDFSIDPFVSWEWQIIELQIEAHHRYITQKNAADDFRQKVYPTTKNCEIFNDQRGDPKTQIDDEDETEFELEDDAEYFYWSKEISELFEMGQKITDHTAWIFTT